MTTTTTTTQTSTCPDWCQSKPHEGDDGPHVHTWPEIPAIDGDEYPSALVSVDLEEDAEHPAVISLIAPNLSLTPKQARHVALALLTVADWAQDQVATS